MTEKKDPPYFMYFPGNYRWSAAFINMLSSGPYGGSEIGELHKIGSRLKGKAPDDDEAWFVEECKRAGIKSMITVFTRLSTQRLVDAGFDAVKIASYDCRSTSLLKEVSQNFRNVVVSTGASFDNEILDAAKLFDKNQVSFLHCVTIYPTPLDQLHMNRMDWLRQFSVKVGFSDHTTPATTNL